MMKPNSQVVRAAIRTSAGRSLVVCPESGREKGSKVGLPHCLEPELPQHAVHGLERHPAGSRDLDADGATAVTIVHHQTRPGLDGPVRLLPRSSGQIIVGSDRSTAPDVTSRYESFISARENRIGRHDNESLGRTIRLDDHGSSVLRRCPTIPKLPVRTDAVLRTLLRLVRPVR